MHIVGILASLSFIHDMITIFKYIRLHVLVGAIKIFEKIYVPSSFFFFDKKSSGNSNMRYIYKINIESSFKKSAANSNLQ